MDDFNYNVLKEGHFQDWNDKFGKNFTDNFSAIHKQQMIHKNIETGGAYQAAVSGAYGEFTIATVFKSLPNYYHVMNDIILQQGTQLRPYRPDLYGESPWQLVKKKGKVYEVVKKSTQLDHLIVSPFGLFIIETKNHKGWIFGDINGKVWTQVLNGENGIRAYGGHAHFTFYNPVAQNYGHLTELAQQLKLSMDYMAGMIVFTNPEANLDNVNCPFCLTIDQLYDAILCFDKQIWTERETEKVIEYIEKLDTNSYSLTKEHEMYVKDIKHRHDINIMRKKGML